MADARPQGARRGDTCTHLDASTDPAPTPRPPAGCSECEATGIQWVHLRLCLECGHVGCCDSSPGRNATGHFRAEGHPLVRSFEPGEDWWWCYADDLFFEVAGAPPAPSHP
ncbi:MAG: UBP-type zinc finger domain-containing protein [Acidimicrobiales bacterium]